MKKLILFIIVAILTGSILYRFIQTREDTSVQTVDLIQSIQGYPVETLVVKYSDFKKSSVYWHSYGSGGNKVFADLGEYIAEVLVKEGQNVSKGQVLFKLSKDNPQAAYNSLKLAYDNAKTELGRIESLFEQGAVPKQMLDVVTLQHDLAREALETATDLLELTAPLSGKVTQLSAEVGGYALPGLPLAKIVAKGNPRVKINIPAADRGYVEIGQSCEIGSRGNTVAGKINRIAQSANPEGRYFEAWITLLNIPESYAFSPGLATEVMVQITDVSEAVTLPHSAIKRSGNRYSTFVVNGDRVSLRDLTIGGENASKLWITSGVNVGEQVVVRGASLLEDNAPIRIISES